jgi:putative DNA primase/helicase
MPGPVCIVTPVWVVHTYIFDRFPFTPYLNVVTPEPGCGKTTFGDVLSTLCARATSPMSGTAAGLRHMIEEERPTLIIDEWDALDAKVRKACVCWLNSGFRWDGKYRLGNQEPISTYCPKIVIGRSTVHLPEATLQRCIPIRLQKALPSERLEKFTTTARHSAVPLAARIEFLAKQTSARGVFTHSSLDRAIWDGFSARQEDICEPLLELASQMGGPWLPLVRQSLKTLLADQSRPTPENELLRATKNVSQSKTIVRTIFSHSTLSRGPIAKSGGHGWSRDR